MREVIIGAVAMGFATAALFFLRFWRDTQDRLFAFFSLALLVLSVNRLGFLLVADSDRRGDYLYWIRLIAFIVIMLAVIDKNIARKPRTN
jgi:hypothetical protein